MFIIIVDMLLSLIKSVIFGDDRSIPVQAFVWLILIVGAVKIASVIVNVSMFLVRRCRGMPDFYKKYGGGWVVVTGGSDGIGEEICR